MKKVNSESSLLSLIQNFKSQAKLRYGKDFFINQKKENGIYKITLLTHALKEKLEEILKKEDQLSQVKIESIEEDAGDLYQVTDTINLYTKRVPHLNNLADQLIKGEIIRVYKAKEQSWVPVVVLHDFVDHAPKQLGWIKCEQAKLKPLSDMPIKEKNGYKLTDFYQQIDNYLSKNSQIKYVLGGKSKELGFDCSSFLQVVIQSLSNQWMPRLSRWQSLVGQEVDRRNLKPMDVVYFEGIEEGEIGRIVHIGFIYNVGSKIQFVYCTRFSNGIVIADEDQIEGYKVAGFRRII